MYVPIRAFTAIERGLNTCSGANNSQRNALSSQADVSAGSQAASTIFPAATAER